MPIFLIVCLAIVGVCAVVAIWASTSLDASKVTTEASHQRMLQSLTAIDGFNPAVVFPGRTGGKAIALDPTSDQFAIGMPDSAPRVYRFDQLVAAEVVKNERSIVTTKGKVDTQGAALATLLAGPVGGLLVGAKTSSTSTTQNFTTGLGLKLIVNDLHLPSIYISFLGYGPGWGENGIEMHKALSDVEAWFGRFQTIIVGMQRQALGDSVPFKIQVTPPPPEPKAQSWFHRTFSA